MYIIIACSYQWLYLICDLGSKLYFSLSEISIYYYPLCSFFVQSGRPMLSRCFYKKDIKFSLSLIVVIITQVANTDVWLSAFHFKINDQLCGSILVIMNPLGLVVLAILGRTYCYVTATKLCSSLSLQVPNVHTYLPNACSNSYGTNLIIVNAQGWPWQEWDTACAP